MTREVFTIKAMAIGSPCGNCDNLDLEEGCKAFDPSVEVKTQVKEMFKDDPADRSCACQKKFETELDETSALIRIGIFQNNYLFIISCIGIFLFPLLSIALTNHPPYFNAITKKDLQKDDVQN